MNKTGFFYSYINSSKPRVTSILAYLSVLIVLTGAPQNVYAQSITQIQPLNGSPGTSLTIYGELFNVSPSSNTVRFTPAGGGSATTATVTSASATKLIVTIPTLTGGNYTLSVQRPNIDNNIIFGSSSKDLISVSTGGVGFGATGSSGSIISTDANGANDVFTADVDSDGDLDVLSASTNDDKIAWYENDGATDPSFTEHVVSTNADGANSVYAVDVNGDSHLDILSASGRDNKIAWYENDGSENFTERIVSTNALNAKSVFAADLDGDGDIDFMSASRDDDKIAWYENDGSENFTERVVSITADGATSIYTTDVDGDGDIDILSASFSDGKIAWYENNGAANPSFTERVISTDADRAYSVHAADVDGDGDIDLMSAASIDDKIAWYENDGAANPSFTERVVSTNADGVYSVFTADVDGDGDIDLMSASSRDDKIAWYENDGATNPSFTERLVNTTANSARRVYAGDLDGDGDIDIVSASNVDRKISWYENAPPSYDVTQIQPLNGTAGTSVTIYGSGFDASTSGNTISFIPAGGGSATTATVTAASANKLTVTVPAMTGGNYTLSVQRGSDNAITTSLDMFSLTTSGGDFGAVGSSENIVSTDANFAVSVFAGDVDGDGDLDLMSASRFGDEITWYENDGNQDFTTHIVSIDADGARSVFAADVDNDGDLDILSASENDDKVVWFENDGANDPSFTERVVSTNANGAKSVFAADVDGDGDIDIMSASTNDDKIAWYENNGAPNPSFTEHVITTNADGAYSVFAGDVDGDGDIDLMSASTLDDKIAWYENEGNQNFTEHVVSTNAGDTEYVHAADVDGDGDLDILSASFSDDKIAWYENDGSADPSFTERIVSTSVDGARSLYPGDIDGDGDIDIATASFNRSKISWFENDGNQAFIERVVSTSANGANSVFAADVNGDGNLDLISASTNDDKIAWYENTSSSAPLSITQLHQINGTVGSSLSIYGTGFDAASSNNTVNFIPAGGGTATKATITSASTTKLTVTIPSVTIGNYTLSVQRISDAATATTLNLFGVSNGGGNFGAVGSSENIVSTNANDATDLHAADVDGDGDIDLMSASSSDDKIAWYENDGSENFTERIVSTNADGAYSVFAADVDGDGDIDLMSASVSDDKIAWYENNGASDPSFTERVVSTTAIVAREIYAVDVDGDGDIDLLSASTNDHKIAWYENDGAANPSFTEHVVTTNADGAKGVYAGDVDGDGYIDILSASSYKIAWYENDGASDPSFTERVVSTNVDGAFSVYAGDIDGDGDLDLMSASYEDGKIAWYENDGASDPSFTERVVSTNADGATDVLAGDIDGDGDLDLMSASVSDDKIAWYENDGAANPSFTERAVSTSADKAISVFTSDVDGDGDLDVISASLEDNKIAWYENTLPAPAITQIQPLTGISETSVTIYGSGFDASTANNTVSFTPTKGGTPKTATVTAASATKLTVTVPLITGDNYTLSVKRASDNTTASSPDLFAVSTGGGDFGAVESSERVVSTNADQAWSVFSADVDGDGDLDLMSASVTDDKIAWYENDGANNPSFTEQVISTTANGAQSVYAADVDGDGDIDLLSASNSDDKIAWYENDGAADPAFTERVVSTSANFALSVFATDVDGDGDIDILSASQFDDKIAWYENDGNPDPLFTVRIVSTNADGAYSINAADVDGDGDIDLMSASVSDDKIAWYENDGAANPSFTERVVSTSADGAINVFAADVDGDGDIDLMSTSFHDNKIAWYENDGVADPSFSEHVISTNTVDPYSIFAADVNGDGNLDLMSASKGDDKITLYENDGNQSFTELVLSTNADGASSIYAADVDGDGDIDILSASQSDDKIAWYENTYPAPAIAQLQPLSGTTGASLTIYGSGFDPVTANNSISFTPAGGGTATTATITNGSKTQLNISVPAVIGGNYTLSVKRTTDSAATTSPELFGVTTGGGNFGAVESSKRVVNTNIERASAVYASDMDGDGDLDLLTATDSDDKIAWHENDGAADPSFTEHILSSGVSYSYAMHAADLDNDGDNDIISASYNPSKLVWYENDGTADPSFTERGITTNVGALTDVYVTDVNNDGNLDILYVSTTGDKIVWYENNGASDPSFTRQVVSTNHNGAWTVYAEDVDGDDDIDFITASLVDNKIYWYKNDGSNNPSFTQHVVGTNANNPYSIFASDLDNDGDIDILSASKFDDKIAWYENNGATDPSFTTRIITTTADGAQSIFSADMDGDGDNDIISAYYTGDQVAWLENDGATNPSFTEHLVSATADGDWDIYAADLDNDGDLDIISASFVGNKITWYENNSVVSTGGRSLAFDGAGDFLEVSDNNALDFTNSFTIEAWVRPTTIDATFQQILGKEGAYRFGFNNSVLRFSAVGVQDYDLSYSLTAGQWSHLAVVFGTANDATFYVNGANVGTITGSAPVTASANVLDIGQNGSDSEYLNGVMDELRLWSTERSALQIQQNLFQALSEDETNLVANFTFNEEGGSTTIDATSNNFTGNFNGNVTTSNNTHPFGTVITGAEGWRLVSTPAGGASYGELLSGVFTQGFTGADSESGGSNVFTYDETTSAFSSITNATDAPAAGSGFIVYVFEDDDPLTAGIQGGFPKTVLTDSSQNEGATSASITYTDTGAPSSDGFNLVGNPYGTTIDWDATSGWTRTGLDASFYVWSDSANGGAGAYLSWNGITGTQGDGKIAPWQGFWVKANAENPTLSFTDQIRSSGGVFLKKKPASTLSLTLKGNDQLSSTIVSFQDKASILKDRYDTYKLKSLNGEYLSLFTQLNDGTGLDINALPIELEVVSIPLGFEGSDLSGIFELSWSPKNLPTEMTITLADTKTGEEIDLREASSYSFRIENLTKELQSENEDSTTRAQIIRGAFTPNVMKSKSSASAARFLVRITTATSVSNEPMKELPTSVELQQNYPNPFNPSTTITFGVPEAGEVTLEVFDLLGRKVVSLLNRENKSAGRYSVHFDAQNLSSGMYIYRLQAGNITITKKLTLIK
ncbi:MAG: FG-GAP-like repeat-containing protein [Balneola sp.]